MAHHLKTKKSRFSPLWFLLILIPLFAAIYFYFTLNPDSVMIGSFTEARISRAGKEVAVADAETITLFKNAVTTGKQVIESTKPLSEYAAASLTLSDSLHSARTYTLFLSSSSKDCFYKDPVDALFAMNAEDAMPLLTMDEFDFVYPSAPPKLTFMLGQSAETIEPSCDSWKFLRADGSEKEVQISADAPLFTRAQETLSVVFEQAPETATLQIRNANTGETLFSGAPEKLSVFAPSGSPLLRVEISAHYVLSEEYPAYGTANYVFFLQWNADNNLVPLPGSAADGETVTRLA